MKNEETTRTVISKSKGRINGSLMEMCVYRSKGKKGKCLSFTKHEVRK